MRNFKNRPLFSTFLPSSFQQAQFAEQEDILLEQGDTPVEFCAFPHVTLSFSTSAEVSRYELSRVLYIFRRTFNIKPHVIPTRIGGYKIKATFPPQFAHRLLSFFLYLRSSGKTKYLKFFFVEGTIDFSFLLFEPITFFPLVHPGFDYYDWVYPFEFTVNFPLSYRSDYLLEVADDTFNV
jgi:hypothetical protein